jgi:hypothetical protein
MIYLDDLKTRAGLLLYRQLPEEFRYRDQQRRAEQELGDLEAFLHGCGHLLDLIRGTTEQAYADAFAEEADNGRLIQTWLLPYLAELVGAELLAPDPARRVDELNNAVTWFKTKGTLINVDSVSDVISGVETVLVEGWRRILITPRLALPPFTARAEAMGDGDPLGPATFPLGTPDLRRYNRAVADAQGANPLYRLRSDERDSEGRRVGGQRVTYWRPRDPRGTPCFPNAYDDTSLRTPDLRDPLRPDIGPHPRRTSIHVRPPSGLFEEGLKAVTLPAGPNPLGFDTNTTRTQTYGPHEVLEALGELAEPAPEKILVHGDLSIPPSLDIAIEGLLFRGRVDVGQGGNSRLSLSRCAVAELGLEPGTGHPLVEARDCLFGLIDGAASFAQLVYCTVLGVTEVERLWASDCLFAGELTGVDCAEGRSCVRYSRLEDVAVMEGCVTKESPMNTTDDPNFVRLYFKEGDDCVLRPAAFGEPGCGVLDLVTSPRIGQGAQDEGEMGVYHHHFHLAQIRALRRKLRDFLPLGQEVSIRYDPCLARPPAAGG